LVGGPGGKGVGGGVGVAEGSGVGEEEGVGEGVSVDGLVAWMVAVKALVADGG